MSQRIGQVISSKLKAHHAQGRFRNIWPTWRDPSLWAGLKWGLTRKPAPVPDRQVLDRELPVLKPNLEALWHPPPDGLQVTWIGHATVLVQFEGLNILTDPVWSDRCSPTPVIGVPRIRPVPCALEELPPIHAVCLSHNHYDHLDYSTVLRLGNRPTWFVPLGLKRWFASVNISNVVELDWWEEYVHRATGVRFAATPAQHWSGRFPPFDSNKTLWCGWAVLGRQTRFYFAGDTGYCPAFSEIGATYGPFSLAAIPIGAYHPRSFLSPQHADASEAARIHLDLRAQHSVGIHWGTFMLTDEPVLEPPQLLRVAMKGHGRPDDEFLVLKHGETRTLPSGLPPSPA